MQPQRYRVHTPIRGVYAREKGFTSIPSGAILVAVRDSNSESPYVTVQWDNCELFIFPRDLTERTVECG